MQIDVLSDIEGTRLRSGPFGLFIQRGTDLFSICPGGTGKVLLKIETTALTDFIVGAHGVFLLSSGYLYLVSVTSFCGPSSFFGYPVCQPPKGCVALGACGAQLLAAYEDGVIATDGLYYRPDLPPKYVVGVLTTHVSQKIAWAISPTIHSLSLPEEVHAWANNPDAVRGFALSDGIVFIESRRSLRKRIFAGETSWCEGEAPEFPIQQGASMGAAIAFLSRSGDLVIDGETLNPPPHKARDICAWGQKCAALVDNVGVICASNAKYVPDVAYWSGRLDALNSICIAQDTRTEVHGFRGGGSHMPFQTYRCAIGAAEVITQATGDGVNLVALPNVAPIFWPKEVGAHALRGVADLVDGFPPDDVVWAHRCLRENAV